MINTFKIKSIYILFKIFKVVQATEFINIIAICKYC